MKLFLVPLINILRDLILIPLQVQNPIYTEIKRSLVYPSMIQDPPSIEGGPGHQTTQEKPVLSLL